MPPAARISDMHTCPMSTGPVPHVGRPIVVGCPTVMIGFMPATRVGDLCVCVGPPDTIAKGSATVMIGNTVGDEQMLKAVRFGITQARNHGFTFRGPVQLYLELMLLFGSYFDTDPQYPWAAAILARQDSGSQMQRAEQLY